MSKSEQDSQLMQELQTMKAKVICLEAEKSDAYVQLRKYKDALIAHRTQLTGLQEHLNLKKELETQIDNYRKQIVELQGDLDRLRDLLKDTESDMKNYQNQCQDSMDLIEKLTSNNVDLKIKVTEFSSELDSQNAAHKVRLMEFDTVRRELSAALEKVSKLSSLLSTEQDARRSEGETFRADLAEKEATIQRLQKEAEDSSNEKRLSARMYQATLKDLKRQLTAATKTYNGSENGRGDHDSSDQTSLRSRASSSSSADHSPVLFHGSASCHALSSHTNDDPFIPSPRASSAVAGDGIDQSVLIAKIMKLQRELARKDEKLDFLEDHVALLTSELRKRPK
ncbi:hypothetical protein BV898_00484 [Hypsibius exemplaris]|uniref:Uncharacterized protein n=1 Tax=Hypsibius exemplaris TaxID=2072580 RepID=A0A1W0XDJ4_HYPEX|nr:hypothetical protein BV898_00484 [Hypsibius exemplaris]